ILLQAFFRGCTCNFSYDYARAAAEESLEEYLEKNNIMALSDVDTRALTSHIRDHGAMNAVIATADMDVEALKKELRNIPRMKGQKLAGKVAASAPSFYG